jgi:3-deoxy-D-manno-octulosonate 8-phosphate phosphatase (KDO 8-P phosphatase)
METNQKGKSLIKPKFFIVDVDGVLTDGKFVYTSQGKVSKTFGPDDNDALGLLKKYLTIHMVSGDKRGYEITKKRIIDDMHFPLDLISTFDRAEWIKNHYNLEETIYMGDGIFDSIVFAQVAYSIAPANAFYIAKDHANFVTKSKGSEGAVAEACLHIMEKFFEPLDPLNPDLAKYSGVWKANK